MNRLASLTLLLLLVLAGCQPSGLQVVPSDALVIVNGQLVDGTGGPAVPDAVVVIAGGKIVGAGPAYEFAVPEDVARIDAQGGTIMPGIIDSHVHYSSAPETRQRFLQAGVTSVCDLGTSLPLMAQFDRRETAKGAPAANGFQSGPMITAPSGYPNNMCPNRWGLEVADDVEARAAVAQVVSLGADFVKVALEPGPHEEPWPVPDAAVVAAVVEQAHAAGLPVRAHVRQAGMLERALAGGVDVVEHVPLPFKLEGAVVGLRRDGSLPAYDETAYLAQIDALAAHDVILVPTLVAFEATLTTRRVKMESVYVLEGILMDGVARHLANGGTVALGTDYGTPGVQPGMPLREMALLQRAGLTPLQIIHAATGAAATACGQEGERGLLLPGQVADVIVVAGDPLQDFPGAMEQVTVIIQGGTVVKAP